MFDDDLLTYLESYLTEERKQRFLDVLQQRTRHITIAIEDVYQLHNTSAILRSCDAFGVQDLHVIENRFGKRLDKNIAMGAEQCVDVYRYKNGHSSVKFYSTYMLHLSLKAKFYQVFRSYLKILIRGIF